MDFCLSACDHPECHEGDGESLPATFDLWCPRCDAIYGSTEDGSSRAHLCPSCRAEDRASLERLMDETTRRLTS